MRAVVIVVIVHRYGRTMVSKQHSAVPTGGMKEVKYEIENRIINNRTNKRRTVLLERELDGVGTAPTSARGGHDDVRALSDDHH